MMELNNALGGMLRVREMQNREQLTGLQSVLAAVGAAQRQQEMQQQAQLDPLRREIMQTQVDAARRGADQAKAVDDAISSLPPELQARARLDPQGFVRAMFPAQQRPTVVPQGGMLVGPDGRVMASNPKEQTQTNISRAMAELEKTTNPQHRAMLENYIRKMTTHQPAVNVYSGSLTPGVDESGNPVFVQPSSREGVAPRKVEGVYPAPKPNANAGNAQQIIGEYEAADQLIDRMINGIRSGGRFGSVGVPGQVSRAYETVAGTVNAKEPTPTIDLENDKEVLISKMKSLATRKDSNYSNQDALRDEKALGLDRVFTTPTAAVRALTNIKNDLRSRRMNLNVNKVNTPSKQPQEPDIDSLLRKYGG